MLTFRLYLIKTLVSWQDLSAGVSICKFSTSWKEGMKKNYRIVSNVWQVFVFPSNQNAILSQNVNVSNHKQKKLLLRIFFTSTYCIVCTSFMYDTCSDHKQWSINNVKLVPVYIIPRIKLKRSGWKRFIEYSWVYSWSLHASIIMYTYELSLSTSLIWINLNSVWQ